jgi:hypothetical protein
MRKRSNQSFAFFYPVINNFQILQRQQDEPEKRQRSNDFVVRKDA